MAIILVVLSLFEGVRKFDRDIFYSLDMNKSHIRSKVRGVTSNTELDKIFDKDATAKD